MARKYQSLLPWPPRALEAALWAAAAVFVPQTARAEADNGASGEATGLIDRTQIASAVAFDRDRTRSQSLGGIPLILSVEVNGMDHGLAQFRLIDDQIWATRTVLANLGLRLDAEEDSAPDAQVGDLIQVADALGGSVAYDAGQQSLVIMVEVSRLAVATSRININRQEMPVAQSATGALINYDLIANANSDGVSLDGFTETRLFSGHFLFENTGLVRLGEANGADRSTLMRLDSTAAFSIPEKRLTVRAGDIITRSTSWSRPTRIGGLRLGTDFALQPYLVTAPIPTFFGEATLPSTVDLYIDGINRYSGEVAPGAFEVGSGGNRINGAGNAQVVVTDILGQVTTLDFPIYDSPQLLRGGLTDWSLEAGFVRENYGIASFDYASGLVASASVRHGLNDRLTLEGHGEAGEGVINAGAGAAWIAPFQGVVSGSVALSEADGEVGHRWELGYSWTNSNFNLSATIQRASVDYADIASRHGGRAPLERELVNVGYHSQKWGTFGASLIRQLDRGEERQSYLGLNWHKPIAEHLSFSLSANQNLEERRERGVFLSLTFTPGSRDRATASLQANERRTTGALGFRRTVPQDGGTGFAVDASHDGDRLRAAAQIDHLTSAGQVTAGLRQSGSQTRGYAGYSGALVVMGGDAYVSRKVFDGFAVVQTGEASDVPVKLHNREIGRTNGDGNLLITGLNAYQTNKVSIDTADLPATLSVSSVEAQAVPNARAGVIVNFPIRPVHSVLASLVDEAGEKLPVGLGGWQEGAEDDRLFVGFDGQLFIEEAVAGAHVTIETPQGPCGFDLPEELPSQAAGRLGQQVCKLD